MHIHNALFSPYENPREHHCSLFFAFASSIPSPVVLCSFFLPVQAPIQLLSSPLSLPLLTSSHHISTTPHLSLSSWRATGNRSSGFVGGFGVCFAEQLFLVGNKLVKKMERSASPAQAPSSHTWAAQAGGYDARSYHRDSLFAFPRRASPPARTDQAQQPHQ